MEWISTKDELPKDNQTCIIAIPHVGTFVAWYNEMENTFEMGGVNMVYVTKVEYWMPIPVMPEID